MESRTQRFLLTGLFLCLCVAACASGVSGTKVDLLKYTPSFSADLSGYQGKHIYLLNAGNEAQNTTIWYYYSPDKQFTYSVGDNSIENYFWYSFEKALRSLGMVVSTEDRPDPIAPGMQLTLKSISDAEYTVEVKLKKLEGPFFTKVYTVPADPIAPAERTAGNLEQRAYAMTNRLITAVLSDPEFQDAFFMAAAQMAAPRK
jgi:hypothetical protein